jgi:hypothetical protein
VHSNSAGGHGARAHVAADADFERNFLLREVRQERRIFDRADAVPDPLRSNFERFPDAGCIGRLQNNAGRRGHLGIHEALGGQPFK